MINKIKTILEKNNIKAYRINCTESKSFELFFVKKETDMVRSTDVTEYSVTVYRDFSFNNTEMRGHATALLFPDMTAMFRTHSLTKNSR
jgi:predicted Zn-dependent protease